MFSMGDKKKDVSTPRICDVVWHDGEFIKWSDARVHVMSHVLHYGSSVFEGIRCYATKRGPAIFRLREHMQRFLNSAKVYRMDHKWSLDDFCDAAVELVRRSNLEQCYIRPILFRSLDEEGWNRVGSANNNAVSVRALAFIMAGHVRHHMKVLQQKYLFDELTETTESTRG